MYFFPEYEFPHTKRRHCYFVLLWYHTKIGIFSTPIILPESISVQRSCNRASL